MSNEEAQRMAPSYLRLPNDGAKYRCDECQELFPFQQVLKVFTPDKKVHFPLCIGCLDTEWIRKAKDCGILTLSND